MAERQEKLQRLNVLRRSIPSCSKSALEAILKHIAKDGLCIGNRKQMREAAEKHLQSYSSYGPLIVHKEFTKTDGTVGVLPMVNFYSLLSAACRANGSFYHCIKAVITSLGSDIGKEWNLILYRDECLPANALGKSNKKVWVVYCSFKELGRVALSHTQHWLALAIV